MEAGAQIISVFVIKKELVFKAVPPEGSPRKEGREKGQQGPPGPRHSELRKGRASAAGESRSQKLRGGRSRRSRPLCGRPLRSCDDKKVSLDLVA